MSPEAAREACEWLRRQAEYLLEGGMVRQANAVNYARDLIAGGGSDARLARMRARRK